MTRIDWFDPHVMTVCQDHCIGGSNVMRESDTPYSSRFPETWADVSALLYGDPNAPLGGGLLGPAPRPSVPPGRVTRQQRRADEKKWKAVAPPLPTQPLAPPVHIDCPKRCGGA